MTAVARADTLRAFEGPVRHVYVHVPFCRAKCDYCDFASAAVGDAPDGALLDGFVTGVAAEWERERAAHDVRRLHTLYLGGGTPSLLGPGRLERLLELFRPQLTPHAEVTVETNPEDVDEAFAAWAAAAPLAGGAGAARGLRVSLGVQSFSPDLREALGRRAQADPAEAFERLRRAGVANLSLDLIQGIPGQTEGGAGGGYRRGPRPAPGPHFVVRARARPRHAAGGALCGARATRTPAPPSSAASCGRCLTPATTGTR